MGPKTAMVLAAGLGTRMRPLSDTVPKPLIKLGGEALIDRVLGRLAGAGVEKAIVNTHYLADQVEAHLADREHPQIVISPEPDEILDTGGGVKNALDLLGEGPFFVHNSDSVWVEGASASLQRMSEVWDPEQMDALLLVAPTAYAIGYQGSGDFALAPDGSLRRRKENEVVPFVFAGVSIGQPSLFADSPDGPFSLNLLWDRALEAGRLRGVRLEGVWMHVGTPEALAEAERLLAGDEE
jgi:MurNAc alpha-1-phosphate uridylyltransferase